MQPKDHASTAKRILGVAAFIQILDENCIVIKFIVQPQMLNLRRIWILGQILRLDKTQLHAHTSRERIGPAASL